MNSCPDDCVRSWSGADFHGLVPAMGNVNVTAYTTDIREKHGAFDFVRGVLWSFNLGP